MTDLIEQFKIALKFLIIITLLTGLIYPSLVTLLAQGFFPWKANGSILTVDGKKTGSLLIGQYFSEAKYFWGRQSVTARFPYDAGYSAGYTVALSNPSYLAGVRATVDTLHTADPQQSQLIPADLVTTSASGLDPDISPAAAFYQVSRIARVRNLPENVVTDLVRHFIQGRTFGFLGAPRVNVLELNLALDRLKMRQDIP